MTGFGNQTMGQGTAAALAELAAVDADLARAARMAGDLPDRSRAAGFPSLARIIVEQQVSIASARAIWGRLEAAVDPFTPERLLAFDEAALRDLGLSGRKALYCRNLAAALAEGALDLDALHALEDEAVVEALTRVKGVGRWTAEIYLLFAMQRPDVWPAGDLALREAVRHLKGLAERPSIEDMSRIAEGWRPWRGTAARLLWRYYAVAPKA